MVLVSVSMGSTALVEGIGRGIPGMIVRDQRIEDYTALSAEFSQVGDIDCIVSQIRSCDDSSFYTALARKHLEWYAAETHFPGETTLPSPDMPI